MRVRQAIDHGEMAFDCVPPQAELGSGVATEHVVPGVVGLARHDLTRQGDGLIQGIAAALEKKRAQEVTKQRLIGFRPHQAAIINLGGMEIAFVLGLCRRPQVAIGAVAAITLKIDPM
jgi:hypothetical protein